MKNLQNIAETLALNVKENREKKGLSISQLAKMANIGKSTLSVLETGKGNPNIETIWSLATALEIPFGQLINEKDEKVVSVKKGEGISVLTQAQTMQAELLVSRPLRSGFDVFQIKLKGNSRMISQPHKIGTNEIVIAIKGDLTIGPVSAPISLKEGDTAFFSASTSHIYQAHDEDVEALVIMDYE